MTTGGIVDHDPDQLTFVLPPQHAGWLTRAAGPANLAIQAQYVGLLALVEDQIVECFRHGGGVPYSAYPKFHALMAEDSGALHDAALIDTILPVVPGVVDRLQQGIWRSLGVVRGALHHHQVRSGFFELGCGNHLALL